MVVGAFPAAKLGALILKQISKPIANIIKEQAKNSPIFRNYICMPPAQFYNWCEVKSKMWILNLGKPVNIPVLNEAMAIELGANILGEGIIFIFAAGAVLFEYNRSNRKEAAKEAAKEQELTRIRDAITELFIQSEEQAAQLRELMRKLGDLDTKMGQKNTPSKPSSPVEPAPKTPTNLPSEHPPTNTPSEQTPVKHIPSPGHRPAKLSHSKYDLSQHTVRYSDPNFHKRTNSSVHNSLILKAVDDVENQFWNSPLIERQNSIVVLAVYHVNKLFRFQQ